MGTSVVSASVAGASKDSGAVVGSVGVDCLRKLSGMSASGLAGA